MNCESWTLPPKTLVRGREEVRAAALVVQKLTERTGRVVPSDIVDHVAGYHNGLTE